MKKTPGDIRWVRNLKPLTAPDPLPGLRIKMRMKNSRACARELPVAAKIMTKTMEVHMGVERKKSMRKRTTYITAGARDGVERARPWPRRPSPL
jgi:hypothetical protein